MLTTYSIPSESKDKVVIHVTQDLLLNHIISNTGIPYGFIPMSIISADIKRMPLSNQGFNYIVFATCEISNYVIGITMQKANTVTIMEALLKKIVYQFGPPRTLIIDEDSTYSADVLMYI